MGDILSGTTLLEMKHIHKKFPGVYALKDINFELRTGEVHALLGENGAGKSTLIKVLGGIYTADEGEIIINGKKVNIDGVKAAQANGVAIIHQELVLVPYMTVAENIFLGREPMSSGKKTGRAITKRRCRIQPSGRGAATLFWGCGGRS